MKWPPRWYRRSSLPSGTSARSRNVQCIDNLGTLGQAVHNVTLRTSLRGRRLCSASSAHAPHTPGSGARCGLTALRRPVIFFRPMPRSADPTDIPERLLAAGLELFLRQGYNATGIQQITDQAGVPKGSFYNHFDSKEAFGAAIVDRYAAYSQRSWQRMMRSAPAEPLAAIRHVFEQMLAHHARA